MKTFFLHCIFIPFWKCTAIKSNARSLPITYYFSYSSKCNGS